MNRYQRLRGDNQETYYNIGRMFHQMNILPLAMYFYGKCLKVITVLHVVCKLMIVQNIPPEIYSCQSEKVRFSGIENDQIELLWFEFYRLIFRNSWLQMKLRAKNVQ